MTTQEIVWELARRGVTLSVRAGRVIARPLSAVPPELRAAAQDRKAEILRLLTDPAWTPAHSILATCQARGVALRLDERGDLVVGRAGAKADEPTQPWPALLAAMEAHLEAVAQLVETGWTLKVSPELGRAA